MLQSCGRRVVRLDTCAISVFHAAFVETPEDPANEEKCVGLGDSGGNNAYDMMCMMITCMVQHAWYNTYDNAHGIIPMITMHMIIIHME